MRHRRTFAIPVTAAAVVAGLAINASAGAAAGSGAVTLKGSRPAAASTTPRAGSVSPSSRIDFEVQLRPSDLAGAQAFAKAVSTPGSASYRKFLTPAQWERRFSPTAGQVTEVSRFLSGQRIQGGQGLRRPDGHRRLRHGRPDRARLLDFALLSPRAGQKLRLNDRALSVPRALGAVLAGVTGIDQTLARPFNTTDNPAPPSGGAQRPPAARASGSRHRVGSITTRRSTPPCRRMTTAIRRIRPGRPVATPRRSSAARTTSPAARRLRRTVAIIDAYAAPTLFDDAKKVRLDQRSQPPAAASQFSEVRASRVRPQRSLRSAWLVRRADARRRGRACDSAGRPHSVRGRGELLAGRPDRHAPQHRR